MTHTQGAPALGQFTIRELDGLYSLNDLHKASGGEDRHQPAKFVRLDQTAELIAELRKSPEMANCISTQRGSHGGTYACRELVIAYAAWISPEFHLKVIRVFLGAMTPVQPQLPLAAQSPDLSTEAALRVLRTGRWLMTVQGSNVVLNPAPLNAYVLTAEEFATVIKEPGEIPRKLLPKIIEAAASRLDRD